MSVISRANSLALQGYKHCCHVMLHTPVEEKLFGFYPLKQAVLMQLRFDGRMGFPGGFVDDSEDLETAINREVVEELGETTNPVSITKENYAISHLYEEYVSELDIAKKLCLHFFTKKVPLEQFFELETRRHGGPNLGYEVLGLVRCPVYILRDKRGGHPSFLRHDFVGNSRQQLLIGLEHEGILTPEEIKEVVQLSRSIPASAAKL